MKFFLQILEMTLINYSNKFLQDFNKNQEKSNFSNSIHKLEIIDVCYKIF